MRKQPLALNQRGFTLIEVFVITIVLAILVVIGYPRYVELLVKARQSEAKNNLAFLYTLETAYFKNHNTYVGMEKLTPQNCKNNRNPLGFSPSQCQDGRYAYWVELKGRERFVGHAQSVVPLWDGCDAKDYWVVNEKKSITARNDVTTGARACAF